MLYDRRNVPELLHGAGWETLLRNREIRNVPGLCTGAGKEMLLRNKEIINNTAKHILKKTDKF